MDSRFRTSRALLAAGALLAAAAHAQNPAREIELIPSGPVSIDEATGQVVATDGARIFFDEWMLSAETVRYNRQTGEAEAEGNVIFTRRNLRLTADFLRYRPQDNFAHIENFRVGNGRFYLQGDLLEGNPDNFRFENAHFLPGEPGTFLFRARAGELTVIDRGEIRGRRLAFNLGAIPFLLVPNISQPLDVESPIFEPTLDYSGHIGAVIGAEALVPVNDSLRLGGRAAITTRRGVLFGPAAAYSAVNDDYSVDGAFESGYIHDEGDPEPDINNEAIDPDRYYAEWRHLQFWDGNRASLTAFVRHWSDSEVTRDFYEDSFDYLQNPDSYLEGLFNGDNWQLALFARYALNDFQDRVDRIPELRFSLFPSRIAGPFTHSGFLSAAQLSKINVTDPTLLPENQRRSATRLDGFYGVELNQPLREGVALRLKAGARGYSYDHEEYALSADDTIDPDMDRVFGELGADLNLKAYSIFEYENDTWNIDGLRHIVEPRLAFRHTPQLSGDEVGPLVPEFRPGYGAPQRAFPYSIFDFDGTAFNNYLDPIDIEARRDLDSLSEETKLRLELRNRLQTRAEGGIGSRDLVELTLAADHYFESELYDDGSFSMIHTDLELTPAQWLDIGLFARFDPEDALQTREINTRIAIQDPGYWRIVFGSQYLRGYQPTLEGEPGYDPIRWRRMPFDADGDPARIAEYYLLVERNLGENFKVYASARYDESTETFYEQRIGLLQRAIEGYAINYELRLYDGPRREGTFSIGLGIELFDDL